MNLNDTCKDILMQLDTVIKNLKEEDFAKEIPTLNHSTIGQHIRHTLEFFTCLINNYQLGIINYDKRDHDKVIEKDPTIALLVIKDIISFLDAHTEDVSLSLEANYCLSDNVITVIKTNLFRELAYNIEHAIHHMAIIKIGIKEIASYVKMPDHFGVAVSTVKFHQQVFLSE